MTISSDSQSLSNNVDGTDLPASGENYVKKGNRNRTRNPWRDAWFMPDLLAICVARHEAEGEGTSVKELKSESHIPPPPDPIDNDGANPTIPSSYPLRFLRHLSAYYPHDTFPTSHTSKALGTPRAHRTPPHWREGSSLITCLYRHEAIQEIGNAHSFSLNLSPDIEAKARADKSAANFLLRRITRELKLAFPTQEPACWFVLEQTKHGGRLHLHGEIVSNDPVKMRAALRKAAGEWPEVRQHQAHSKPEPDWGWLGYVRKDMAWNAKRDLNGPLRGLTIRRGFNGKPEASTRNVTGAARGLFEADRTTVCMNAHFPA